MTDVPPRSVPAGSPGVHLDERFFSAVVDASPDGVVIADSEGHIVHANRQAETLFRYRPGTLIGVLVEELLPEEVRSTHRAHRLRYGVDPKTRPMGAGLTLRARRSDGTELPVEISLSPLPTDDQTLFMAAVRDATERVEAEHELRRVLQTLDATIDGVFIFDPDSLCFSYVNQGAEHQVGYSADELAGMTLLHLTPELDEASLRDLIRPLLVDEGASRSLQTMHLRKDGVEVPVDVLMQGSAPGHDGARSIVALARDVTMRLEAEEQLQKSQIALSDAEQAMAVADDRERIARDLHDTVIQRLFASGLQLQAVVARVDDAVRPKIETVVTDLDDTIRDLRTAIFGLQGTSDVPSGLRGQILDLITEAAGTLGREPRLEFDGPIETIGDAVRDQLIPTLREALTNIAKHAGANHVRVSVRAGPDVVLTVTDDGVGLPAELPVGNGLHNMATRATKLGGRLDVAPGPGGSGTQLTFTVPSHP